MLGLRFFFSAAAFLISRQLHFGGSPVGRSMFI
jgi:hypothetical protein